MNIITGRYADAKVFTDNIEQEATDQIRELCNHPFAMGSKIRIMPDVHAGKGCTIGFTATIDDTIIPNLVGVDIGCGMLTIDLGYDDIDFAALDDIINKYVPSGVDVHKDPLAHPFDLTGLHCYDKLHDVNRLHCSMGSLGGGNHFIEIDTSKDGRNYLVIHTGSRNLGKQVADYYQNLAVEIQYERMGCGPITFKIKSKKIIEQLKAEHREKEIETALRQLSDKMKNCPEINKDLCYLTLHNKDDYLHDMQICQDFAIMNRMTIADIILEHLFGKKTSDFEYFETIHNYINIEEGVLRKGAVSAKKGEKLLIPINMKEGSLICEGKGNPDWNCSAPHGAGRICSRSKAREMFKLEDFQRSMDGIYTTSVCRETIDECPMAYKTMDEIVENIRPTAKIIDVITPRYNFKAKS